MKISLGIARSKSRAWLAAVGAAVLCSSGIASANFTCEGKVSYLGLGPDGTVTMSVGFGVWYICNLTAPWSTGGVNFSPEGCRAWYAAILANQKSEQSIVFFFSSSSTTSNGAECTALGSWTAPNPAPYHMGIRGP